MVGRNGQNGNSYLITLPMNNSTPNGFIKHLCTFLPDRTGGKRGPKPIAKEILVRELFKLYRTNCGWREIQHAGTVRNYLKEMQRRGNFQKYFNSLIKGYTKHRIKKSIVDTSDIVSYETNGLVVFNGKYHNYCVKFGIEVDEKCVPIYGRIDQGGESDSYILDQMTQEWEKLPYELYLDKGFERYARRRELKKKNCQIRMEMKDYANSRKIGPRFVFNQEHKHMRGLIEKVVAWIKAFSIMTLSRTRIKALIKASFIFSLSYVTFNRLQKL